MMQTAPARLVVNVDDDAGNLYAKSRVLQRAGLEVAEATNGSDALRLVDALAPALVLLDVNLPDIDGLEVCRRIKSDPRTAQVLVLQTSATFVSREDRVRGLDGGADAYLAQPFGGDELIATVRALLRIQAAEERLRESEHKYQTLFTLSPGGVLLVSPDGAIVDCNERVARGLGYSVEELKRLRVQDMEAQEDPAQIAAHLARLLAVGVDEFETRHRTRDGRVLEVRVAARTVTMNGRPMFLAAWDDISERKRTEAALREADRRKDEFLAMLAHELRNPIAPISNAAEVLRVGRPPEEAARRLYEIVARQATHLSRLVDDLLDISRITEGKVNLQREPVDIKEVFDAALETSRPLMEAKCHRVELSLPGEALWVEGDAVRLAQVVANLLNNAAKYTDEGGSISLCAERVDGQVKIRVRDNGMGIDPETLPHVFELFTQGQRGADRGQGGLGVGLSLVERLVALHGGKVQAHSAGLGKGSEFSVLLPLIDAPPTPQPHVRASSGTKTARRVLVVDDNADSAESLAMLLALHDHAVETSPDGPTALEKAAHFHPDVLVLDIGLPGMDGFELARRLRALPHTEHALLIALSGYGQAEDVRLSREAGFDHHLVKPVDAGKLFALIAGTGTGVGLAGGPARLH